MNSLQEGVAIELCLKVTEGMHGEKGEKCVVERGKIATEETLLGKVEETEANERGRVPELHAVRGIGGRKQSGTNNPGAERMLEHAGLAVMHPVTINTAVNVQAIAPKRWALAWSSQRCTATRAPRPRTRHAMSVATISDAALPVLASAARINSMVPIISAIATMCKGIIIRNAWDRYPRLRNATHQGRNGNPRKSKTTFFRC